VSPLEVALTALVLTAVGTGVSLVLLARHRRGESASHAARPEGVDAGRGTYESILVAFEDHRFVPEVLATAVRLAARRRRGIHVLATVVVPRRSDLDARMPEEELAARAVIEQARLQGGWRVTGHVERVRPGEAGRRIVEEARRLHARAIVMPLPRRGGTSLFGKTLETVLGERPCRVIIESPPVAPGAARRRPSALGPSPSRVDS
jgi:basic amino acid/polyamine antiporter, APA family